MQTDTRPKGEDERKRREMARKREKRGKEENRREDRMCWGAKEHDTHSR